MYGSLIKQSAGEGKTKGEIESICVVAHSFLIKTLSWKTEIKRKYVKETNSEKREDFLILKQ